MTASPPPDLPEDGARFLPNLGPFQFNVRRGRVLEVRGLIVRSSLPDVRLGERCGIRRVGQLDLEAEVIGFDGDGALLMPFGRLEAVAAGAAVMPIDSDATVPCGAGVRGRVLDALGEPIDGRGPLVDSDRAPLVRAPPNPLRRRPNDEPFPTGVRAIDGFLTLARGQRVGIFAAAGGGKSTLLGQIIRAQPEGTAIVLALIGERGREVEPFVRRDLGSGLARSTVVVSTADQSALMRVRAAYTAMAIAEAARGQGKDVLLLVDSVTRFARALRDLGQALREPAGRGGYPASMYTRLPQLFERAGNDDQGTLTALFTVLAESDDLDDPVVEEVKSLLDGHILLSQRIANRGRYPAVDILRSKSRLQGEALARSPRRAQHLAAAGAAVALCTEYAENRDKIKMGRYEDYGMTSEVIAARYRRVEEFLRQDGEPVPFFATQERLIREFSDLSLERAAE